MRGRKRSFRRECNLRRLPIAGVQWPPCRASVFPIKIDNADGRTFVRRGRTFFWGVGWRCNGLFAGSPNQVPPGRPGELSGAAGEGPPPRPESEAIQGQGMRAITVSPGTAYSARLEEVPEP